MSSQPQETYTIYDSPQEINRKIRQRWANEKRGHALARRGWLRRARVARDLRADNPYRETLLKFAVRQARWHHRQWRRVHRLLWKPEGGSK